MSFRSALGAAFFALAAAGVLLTGCGGDGGESGPAYSLGDPVEDSTIAATASAGDFGDTLSAQQFQRAMNPRLPGQGAGMPDSVKQQRQRDMLDQFVDFTALLAEARQRGFSADSSDVTAFLNQRVARRIQQARMQMGGDSLFQERLSENNMTVAQLRQQIRQRLLQRMPRSQVRKQLMLRRLVDTLRQEAEPPTAQEIREHSVEQAREVRLQQILFRVPPRATQAQRDSVQQRAQTVLDSIQNGADFATLAERYGQDEANASMGYQTRRQMASPFAGQNQQPSDVPFVQTAFALQDSGDVAEGPVRTRVGYHLLRKTGERPGQPDTAAARQQLMVQHRQEALEQAIEGLRENVTLRVNPNLVTADMSQPSEDQQDGGTESG